MAVKFTSLKRDLTREQEGSWISLPELMDPETGETPELLVRGLTYSGYQLANAQMRGRLQRRYGSPDAIPNEVFHRENGRLLAQHILLDWRNVSEEYSKQLSEEFLTDPANQLQLHVLRCALELGEVQMEFDSAAAKNSKRSSVGSLRVATE